MQKLNANGLTEEEFLSQYNPGDYERPSLAVDVLIFAVGEKEEDNARKLPEKELKVLLIKRKDHPDIGSWAIPGGFVGVHEGLEEAAYRELREETAVENVYLEQLYTFGKVSRDPRTRVISCSYMALVDSSKLRPVAGDDAEEVAWFTIKSRVVSENKVFLENGYINEQLYEIELIGPARIEGSVLIKDTVEGNITSRSYDVIEKNGLAFDHPLIIWYGLERLRNKIEYTPIVFSLMPPLFTLTELQQVYETVLGRELLAANFRRKIKDVVIPTNSTRSDVQHRPAKLFKYNPGGRMDTL